MKSRAKSSGRRHLPAPTPAVHAPAMPAAAEEGVGLPAHHLADVPVHSPRVSAPDSAASSSGPRLMPSASRSDDDSSAEDGPDDVAASARPQPRAPRGHAVHGQSGVFHGDASGVHIHDVAGRQHLKLGGQGRRIDLNQSTIPRAYEELLAHKASSSVSRGVDGVEAWFAHHHPDVVASSAQAQPQPPAQQSASAPPAAVAEAPPQRDQHDPYGHGALSTRDVAPPDEDDFM